jgi:hypothetical protein
MALNAYVKLVPSSAKETLTIDDVKELFHYYQEITAKTGDQYDWEYENLSFPYEIKEQKDVKGKWLYLSATQDRYFAILLGVDKEMVRLENGDEREQTYIQITLPDQSTYADKCKANEFSKFLSKKLQGELHLFNGRVMYYYPRK